MILSTLPVIIIGILSYTKASADIEEKVAKENMQVLLQTQMRVEHQLEVLDTKVNANILSPDFTSNFQKSITPKDFIEYRTLANVMKKFITDKIWYHNLELVNHDEKWLIDKKGLSQLKEEDYRKHYLKIARTPHSSDWLTFSDENGQSIKLVKKIPLLSKNPKGLIIVTITNEKITEIINEKNKKNEIVVLDKEYKLISNNSSKQSPFLFNDLINKIKNSNATNGYFTTKLKGKSVGINYSKSTFNQWTYLSVVPIEAITKESKDIAWYTVIYCIVIIIIISIIALQWSRRLYNPIHNVYKSVVSLTEDDTDSKDEFDCIQRKIHSIKSSNLQLEHRINNQLNHLREYFVLKLLLGQVKSNEKDSMLVNLKFPTSWHALAVVIINIDQLENTNYQSDDKESLLFAINNIVRNTIAEDKHFSPVFLNDYQVTILLSNEKNSVDQKKYFYSVASKIKTLVLKHLGLQISIGIGRTYDQLEKTAQGYEEAIKALKYRHRLEPGVILHVDDITGNQTLKCNYPKQVSLELLDSIKSANQEESRKLLKEFISYMTKFNIPFHNCQTILAQLLAKILELVQEADESPDQLFGKAMVFDELFSFNTVQEAEDWFNQSIIPPIIDKYYEIRTNQQTNITESVLSIIEDEFYKDITLEYVASKINFHPSYVSRVFKKETGSSFSDYLMRYRINQIKKLLSETNIKISEIAERFHYNSSASFIRSFRKSEGMTPGQYRKKFN
ncbi:helix-turn-helix domain-containing protein [Bacillus sp. SA1-12]|uniref:helix-turn-helix domain-containing protein n=1 Tax=Bacillus sp. SA1-12 TaxID=1455638 RepID=UPI0012DFFAAE|nr:helix-turn-helix domain-containing protein [Bacillus sp. SA1-12]